MVSKRTSIIILILTFLSLTHLTQAQTWTPLSPTGSIPTTRYAHSAVYDAANNRMTIFGGISNSLDFLNDVWVLSTANGLGSSAWTQITTSGSTPTTRFASTAVYDNANNQMILFGGRFITGWLNDVWVLSTANGLGNSAWIQLAPTGSAPTTRYAHTSVYDDAHNRMILFGGVGNGFYLNDLWVLSTANGLGGTPAWTQIFPTGTVPTTRYYHSAVYDNANNRMIIFGGQNFDGWMNDVWVLSNANGLDSTTPAWTQLTPTGGPPQTRYGHTAVYDTTNNLMTLFGGTNGSMFNDVWELTHANGLGGTPAWKQILPTGSNSTLARYEHTAIYDSVNNRMTIYGGEPEKDLWVLSHVNVPVEDWMSYGNPPATLKNRTP